MGLVLAAALAMPTSHSPICLNQVAVTLKEVGFQGADLQTAWAIVMRESHGRANAVSATQDYGWAQINKPTWASQGWWNDKQMLQPKPNARAMYRIAEGGKTFRAWGIDGNGGQHPQVSYGSSVFEKYREWRAKFPKECR